MQHLDPRTGQLVPSVASPALRITGSGPHGDAFPWGGLATGRSGRYTSNQAGKALRSQGHPQRAKLSTILATLKQNKSMYINTSGYVHSWVKPWTGVRAPQGNRHSLPKHIPSLGPTCSVACRYPGPNTTHGPAKLDSRTLPRGRSTGQLRARSQDPNCCKTK